MILITGVSPFWWVRYVMLVLDVAEKIANIYKQ